MKICIIGNSHTISLNVAWREVYKRYPNVALRVFAAAGTYFDDIYVLESKCGLGIDNAIVRERVAASSRGGGDIRFDDCDYCLIIGGFDPSYAEKIGVLGGEAMKGFSFAVMAAAAEDIVKKTDIYKLVGKIREVSDIPIKIMHNPFVAPARTSARKQEASKHKLFDYMCGVKLVNEGVLLGYQAELLPQPSETIVNKCFSKRKFANGERKAFPAEIEAGNKTGVVDDRTHMKPNYGMIRLVQLLELIGEVPQD